MCFSQDKTKDAKGCWCLGGVVGVCREGRRGVNRIIIKPEFNRRVRWQLRLLHKL